MYEYIYQPCSLAKHGDNTLGCIRPPVGQSPLSLSVHGKGMIKREIGDPAKKSHSRTSVNEMGIKVFSGDMRACLPI